MTISHLKQRQIAKLVSDGKRLDGRGLTDYRELKVEVGVIERAEGSARLSLGQTEVIVGVKIEVGKPFADTPDKGVLTVNAELLPLASPNFEPGPPNENAIELARIVDRGIRESKAIDLEKLCIEPKNKVYVVFVDVHILNYDGNLFDASAMAALAALLNTKFYNNEVKEGEVKIKPSYTPLPIQNYPIAITLAKIGDRFVIDPSLEEEQVMESRLTITIEKDGKICSVQKGGSGYLTEGQILEATILAQEKARELRKLLVKK